MSHRMRLWLLRKWYKLACWCVGASRVNRDLDNWATRKYGFYSIQRAVVRARLWTLSDAEIERWFINNEEHYS